MPKSPTNERRGLPPWLLWFGVAALGGGAAIVAAGVVITIMFALVDSPAKHKDNIDPIAQQKPVVKPIEVPNPLPVEKPIVEKPPVKNPHEVLAPSDGFISLFNGKDLTGWNTERKIKLPWHVEDGILIGTGQAGKPAGFAIAENFLCRDFHLRTEVRIGEKGGFSIRFRCPPESPIGYVAQMSNGKSGLRAGLLSYLGVPLTKAFPQKAEADVKPGEWCTLEIIARGNHLVVKVDGKTTVDVLDDTSLIAGKLRLHHIGDCKVEIRKLEFKEFHDVADPVVVAPPVVPKKPVFNAPKFVPGEGFVPLFNGKDLTGWKTHDKQPGSWRVENGILIGDRRISSLYSERGDYTEFHLRAEARINDGGAGGLFARATFGPMTPSFGPKEPLGYKAVINNTALGKKTGQFYAVRVNSASHGGGEFPAAPGEWSLLEIIADGKRIRHLVNGMESQSFPETKLYPHGHVALFLDNVAGVLEFRHIEIKETAAPAAPKAEVFDALPFASDANFVPLFNKKDLAGWQSAKQPGNEWRVVNGVLTGTGKLRELYSVRDDYADFHLRLEVRINEIGASTLAFRYPDTEYQALLKKTGGYAVRIDGRQDDSRTGTVIVHERKGGKAQTLKEPMVAAGKWFNMEILAQGDRITTKLNGKEAINLVNPDALARGRFVLSVPGNYTLTVVEYRRIEIREFK